MLHPIPLNSQLAHTYHLLSQTRFPRSGWFCVVPTLSRFHHGSVGLPPLYQTPFSTPPRTCAAPTSLQECAGACNRLCGDHWVVHGWLKLPNLTVRCMVAEWDSAWGDSPTHGRCQIPTVVLHNHSHTGPGALPGRRGRDREGGTVRPGCDCHECVYVLKRNFGGGLILTIAIVRIITESSSFKCSFLITLATGFL